MGNIKHTHFLAYFSWSVALIATLGSLYFSEILKFTPCVLCWYQRICVYSLVPIILVGIWRKDSNLPYYVLPLSVIGMFISIYHNILYYSVSSGKNLVCVVGISCETKYIEYFGFISIPLLSLTALILITVSMIFYLSNSTQIYE